MRILFTLCLLQLFLNCFSQQTTTVPVNTSESRIIIRCGRFSYNNEPLIVIDGVVSDDRKRIEDLMPIDIDCVWVLKDITAMTIYGSRASNGVIIISTKKAKLRTFIIKDFTDGDAIARASVSFISTDKKDTITMAANDSGIVSTNKLKISTGYEMKVSSIGYHSFSQSITIPNNFLQKSIHLNRDTKPCEPVIVSATQCRTISCTLYCRISGMTIKYMASPKLDSLPQPLSLKVFPNPVQRGGTISLQLNNDGKNKTIRLISLDGKQLMQNPLPISIGNIVFPIHTDSRWASGIYFLQIICEKDRVLASEKIIIQ